MIKNLIPSSQTNFPEQLKIVIFTFLATVIPFSLIVLIFKSVVNDTMDLLTRDPLSITNAPFYTGFFSNIGILLWCSCAAICLLSYAVVKQNNRYRESSKFLLSSGLFTTFIMLDDLFLLHDEVFPQMGIPENLIYLFYALITIFFAVKTRKFVKKTEFVILSAAVGFLAFSLLLDAISRNEFNNKLEDISKLIGISLWLIYFTRLCLRELRSIVRLSSANEK
ncbi:MULTISPECIES: hypothetical protein [unclassified Anabaena]|uniref:hypothetical protein n=1 Tax=unclassified Anabaena TaxID=2619674 RepID=UPI0039C60118